MTKVTVDVYTVPLGTESTSISQYVAACKKVLEKYPSIKSQLNPMSTTLEGDLETILKAIQEMHEAPFTKGANRVSTTIRIDDRRDKEATLEGKIRSVEEKL